MFYCFRTIQNEELAPVLKTQKDTAKHIAHDYFIGGNLLFCIHQALLTTDLKTQSVIVGQNYVETSTIIPYKEGVGVNASFTKITAFAQMNRTHVLLADSGHGCIRSVNRLTNMTQHVAGLCQRVSWSDDLVDSDLQNSRFYRIGSIAYHNQLVFVTEDSKSRIRKIDLQNNIVRTLVDSQNLRKYDAPQMIVADHIRELIYVSTYFGIAQINITSDKFDYMSYGGEKGDKVGQLAISEWNGASGMTLVPNDTLVVADTLNFKIKVINLKTSSVSTWCFYSDSLKRNCSYIKSPRSFVVKDRMLYLSIEDSISAMKLPDWFTYEPALYIDGALLYSDTEETTLKSGNVTGLCCIE